MTRSAFITPLRLEPLFEPGAVFPSHELVRRILSLCWRDCCRPAYLSRAPAPVVQEERKTEAGQLMTRPLQAWWLMDDGIVNEAEGPYSDRLRPFLHPADAASRLWPHYEFCISADLTAVDVCFHRDPAHRESHRTHLRSQSDGRVCVVAVATET